MPNTPVVEINEHNFTDVVTTSPTPVLVDFTAAWCAPCRAIAPHVSAVANQYAERMTVGQCDVEDNRALAERFDVRSMPTLLLFKAGRVVGQLVGAVPRSRIEALIDANLDQPSVRSA